MFDRLPPELTRRIVLANNPSSVVRSSVVSKGLYALDLRKLVMPLAMNEWLAHVDEQEGVTFERRKTVNYSFRTHSRHLAARYGTSRFAVHAVYITNRLAALVGDQSKYDSPYNAFRKRKGYTDWKAHGYLNAEHFERSHPSRTVRNLVCGFLQVSPDPWHIY